MRFFVVDRIFPQQDVPVSNRRRAGESAGIDSEYHKAFGSYLFSVLCQMKRSLIQASRKD